MTAPPEGKGSAGWGSPIAAGAAFAFAAWMVVSLLLGLAQDGALIAPCCCCGRIPLIGFVPAMLLLRRDARLTPGQGFAVSFIAVGIAELAIAAVAVLFGPMPSLPSQVVEMIEASGREAGLSEAEVREQVEMLESLLPYVPILAAAFATLCAGVVGAATVALLRRRAGEPPPPPA
jgi:hypothetical protein